MDYLSHFYLLLKGNMRCLISHVGLLELLAMEINISRDSPKYKKLCLVVSKYDPNHPKFFEERLKKTIGNHPKKLSKIKSFVKMSAKTLIGFKD